MPTSLRAAFEVDKANAITRHRRSIERMAELMSTTPATLYKWLETETMPCNRLAAWEHVTDSDAVVRYLAARAHKVVIDIPVGKITSAAEVHELQATLHDAVGALMAFLSGDTERDACLAQLSVGLEALSWHRENVRKADQPELELR